MSLTMTEGICNNCTGEEVCNRYCVLHAGYALMNFLTKIDVTETRIGEYDSKVKNGEKDLVVYGHKIWESDSPSYLLANINITLDNEQKLKNVFEMTPIKLLDNYCKHHSVQEECINQLHKSISSLAKNKAIVLPLKPHMECEIVIDKSNENIKEDEAPKTRYKYDNARVYYIVWRTNKDTHKLDCTIGFRTGTKEKDKVYTYNMTDYMKYFRVKSTEYDSAIDTSLIQMTNYGIIKPIVITDGKASIAVDGSYVYDVQGGTVKIVGRWGTKGELNMDKMTKTKPLKKLLDNRVLVKNHRKYMAPYMLHEANIINLKK